MCNERGGLSGSVPIHSKRLKGKEQRSYHFPADVKGRVRSYGGFFLGVVSWVLNSDYSNTNSSDIQPITCLEVKNDGHPRCHSLPARVYIIEKNNGCRDNRPVASLRRRIRYTHERPLQTKLAKSIMFRVCLEAKRADENTAKTLN